MRKALKVSVVSGGVFSGLMGICFIVLFLLGRSATENEWQSKLKKHSPAEMRGMIDSLAGFRSDPANFLPLSLLDDEACAASVGNAVNFILGENRLKIVPAWLFYRTNQSALNLIYDRSEDFRIEEGKIVEIRDRSFQLNDILKPNGMYILGYHYHFTQSDSKIIEAGADKNSHVMLLLNRADGHWRGYHLIHRPSEERENPVKVEPIDEMPKELDLVYIWQVKDAELPEKGDNLFLANGFPPYERILPWINHGGKFEYYFDTISVWIMNKFYGTDQFPAVLKISDREVVPVPDRGGLFHGKILAFYKQVPIYYNHGKSSDGKYGREFQCVEFVNRFLVSQGHGNLKKTGHADSYFWKAREKGLIAFPNNQTEKPKQDDILVFDESDHDGKPGHVAVINLVTNSFVCFVQQNVGTQWRKCLPMSNNNGKWFVDTGGSNIPIPVAGWARRSR